MTLWLNRRQVLQIVSISVVTRALGGCSDNTASLANDASAGGDASGSSDGGLSGGSDGSADATVPPVGWAQGGTAAMTAKTSYPNPFDGATAAACALICSTTEGPCTTPTTPERSDVSEGMGGLPVRLWFKVVTADCKPASGAEVQIWHTQRTGVYSGPTPNTGMCSGKDSVAPSKMYFRGKQIANAAGEVYFDTCYPGWYSGRAVHIHFQVKVGAESRVVSQVFFPPELTQDVFANHPEYKEFGQPDTTFAKDTVIGGEADLTPYLVTVKKMSDGALLASKVVTIRASSSETLCAAQGSGGGGPPPKP